MRALDVAGLNEGPVAPQHYVMTLVLLQRQRLHEARQKSHPLSCQSRPPSLWKGSGGSDVRRAVSAAMSRLRDQGVKHTCSGSAMTVSMSSHQSQPTPSGTPGSVSFSSFCIALSLLKLP